MYDVDQLFEIVRKILKRLYFKLSEADIDVFARQVIARAIDTTLSRAEIKRELRKRATEYVNAQRPDYRPRRVGRGGLITVGGAPQRGRSRAAQVHGAELDPDSEKDVAEHKLSKAALENSASPTNWSILREHERTIDLVEDAVEQVSPRNREVLDKILAVVQPGDSLGEIGRQTNYYPTQINRALTELGKVLEGKRPRRPRSAPNSNGSRVEGVEYNPPTVSDEARWRPHDGAVISDIGADERRTVTNGHKPESRPKDIFSIPRPRWADYVEHSLFGRGALLRNLRDDDNVWVDFDKPGEDDKRRRVMRRDSLEFLAGKQKP